MRKTLLLVTLQGRWALKYALLALALLLTVSWIAPVAFRMARTGPPDNGLPFGPYGGAPPAAEGFLRVAERGCPPDFPQTLAHANGPFRCDTALQCANSSGWPLAARDLARFCGPGLVAYLYMAPESVQGCQENFSWQNMEGTRERPLWVSMKAEAVPQSQAEAEALRAIGVKPKEITWSGLDKVLQDAGYIEARQYVGSSWGVSGMRQFLAARQFMNILPAHSFLEIGCGALNAGQFFIDYFDADKYVCVEPNEVLHRQSAAATASIGKNVTTKQARFVTRDDFDPRPTVGEHAKFDRVWSHSVLSHAADWQLMQYFEVIAAVLVPKTGIAMASIRFSDGNGNPEMPSHYSSWVYPSVSYFSFNEARCMARRVGLQLTLAPDTRLFMTEVVPAEFHDWVRMERVE